MLLIICLCAEERILCSFAKTRRSQVLYLVNGKLMQADA
jgi:hypothetical protein